MCVCNKRMYVYIYIYIYIFHIYSPICTDIYVYTYLSWRIELLFSVLDIDDSQTLSFKELQIGLRKLKVHITHLKHIRNTLSFNELQIAQLSGIDKDKVHIRNTLATHP